MSLTAGAEPERPLQLTVVDPAAKFEPLVRVHDPPLDPAPMKIVPAPVRLRVVDIGPLPLSEQLCWYITMMPWIKNVPDPKRT